MQQPHHIANSQTFASCQNATQHLAMDSQVMSHWEQKLAKGDAVVTGNSLHNLNGPEDIQTDGAAL